MMMRGQSTCCESASLDGGKQAIAERDHQIAVVIKIMRQLAHHAEDVDVIASLTPLHAIDEEQATD